MSTAKTVTVPTLTVSQQAKICSDWFRRMIGKEFEQAELCFQQDVKTGGYAGAYERSAARLIRAEMQVKMLAPITEACTGADPMTALEVVKKEFHLHLIETVKRHDGTPEEHRVQALRTGCQGWAIETIDSILTALRAAQA